MEMANVFSEQMTLIGELTQGRELANQLKDQLDPVTSRETCEALLEKIVSTYDKALSMLNVRALKRERSPGAGMLLESSHSPLIANSPRSDYSDPVSKDQHDHKDIFKKRKTLPRWTEQIRVHSRTGLESPLDDGQSWRKYGQKDILGAKYPRAYYRCTHRNTQGCLATKQVQRTDEDASVFEVTYKGRHSCIRSSNSTSSMVSVEKGRPKPNKSELQAKQDNKRKAQEMLSNLGKGLKVETEGLSIEEEVFPSFSFPVTMIEFQDLENQLFSDPIKENELMDCYSPGFLSPAIETEPDLTGRISTPTSVTESPFGDLDFSIDQVDFDSFPLDTLAYFA